MPYSQQDRLISLTTPLGEDVLLLAGFSGHEAISRLFSFHLDLLTEQGSNRFLGNHRQERNHFSDSIGQHARAISMAW